MKTFFDFPGLFKKWYLTINRNTFRRMAQIAHRGKIPLCRVERKIELTSAFRIKERTLCIWVFDYSIFSQGEDFCGYIWRQVYELSPFEKTATIPLLWKTWTATLLDIFGLLLPGKRETCTASFLRLAVSNRCIQYGSNKKTAWENLYFACSLHDTFYNSMKSTQRKIWDFFRQVNTIWIYFWQQKAV